jgi:hypothetical protein
MKNTERIAELEEETDALMAGMDEYAYRLDAAVEVIELLLWSAAHADPAEWVRKIDRLLGQRQTRTRRRDRSDVLWLTQLLETLLSLRGRNSQTDRVIRRPAPRLKTPRERLRLILGGKASSPGTRPPAPRGAPRKGPRTRR